MARIKILHVSDIHFGVKDNKKEQPRIAEALIVAAHDHVKNAEEAPDLCIFSGDLTQSATMPQFSQGEKWLCDLVEPWPDCRVCIVPGNHDLQRPGEKTKIYRQKKQARRYASGSEDRYIESQAEIQKADLFKNFFDWYSEVDNKSEISLVSDWESSFCGFLSNPLSFRGITVRVIGLNTALLSIGNDDKENLAVDLSVVNELLFKVEPINELVIVVGHHPFGVQALNVSSKTIGYERWFTEWNDQEFGNLLMQSTGPHFYLHGHVHKSIGWMKSNLKGSSLAVLGAGASYQGSKWPQYFAFYDLDLSAQTVIPATYSFNNDTGKWLFDTPRSQPFRCAMPVVIDSDSEVSGQCQTFCANHNRLRKSHANVCHEIDRMVDTMYPDYEDNRWDVVKYKMDCEIIPNGDAYIDQTYTFHTTEKTGHFVKFWIAPNPINEPSLPDDGMVLEDLELRVDVIGSPDQDVATVPAKRMDLDSNNPAYGKNYIVVFFLPEVPPGEERTIRVRMNWPRLLEKLISGQEEPFYWCWPNAEIEATIEFKGEWNEIQCDNLSGLGELNTGARKYDATYWKYKCAAKQNAQFILNGETIDGHGLMFTTKAPGVLSES